MESGERKGRYWRRFKVSGNDSCKVWNCKSHSPITGEGKLVPKDLFISFQHFRWSLGNLLHVLLDGELLVSNECTGLSDAKRKESQLL
jgi:hypothetical protein